MSRNYNALIQKEKNLRHPLEIKSQMKTRLFKQLLSSVREGAKILKGKTKPSRIFKIKKLRNKKTAV